MSIQSAIEEKLTAAFRPERLSIINESHLHAGHHHHGSDHHGPLTAPAKRIFACASSSPAFAGMSRVARHRAVNELLAAELAGGVHALAIEPAAPGREDALVSLPRLR